MCASMVTLGNKNADPFQYTCVSLHSCQELNQPFPQRTHTHTLPDFSDTHTHTCRTTLFQTQYKPILFGQQINSWLSRIMSCSHKQIKIAQTDDGWYFALFLLLCLCLCSWRNIIFICRVQNPEESGQGKVRALQRILRLHKREDTAGICRFVCVGGGVSVFILY